MLYSLKPDCYFRQYGDIGYISRPIVGMEEVVDENGAIFLSQLQYSPLSIDELSERVNAVFGDVDFNDIKSDAESFFTRLVDDGFLNCGADVESFSNDGFDYSTLKGRLGYTQLNFRPEESSEAFLINYSKDHPFLQSFHVEITSKCNERCIHCYIPHEQKNTDIEYDMMIAALDQCKQLNVMTIIFSGGEPMLHPYFCDFLKYAKDLDFNVTVLTNLTRLTDEIIEALKYKHVSCVNVSLYSLEPQIHDSITKLKGSCELTKQNILKLIDNNVAVQINCPVMKQNKDSFYHVINWGQDHKCSVVTDYVIMAKSDRSTDNLENRLSKEDLRFVIEKIAENNVAFKASLKTESFAAGGKTENAVADERVCGVGLSNMCMTSNGNVYPCAGWQQFVCGNIKESSLVDIWNNSPNMNYLRKLRLGDFEKCVGCPDFKFCLMCVCRNYNESESASMFAIPQITCDAANVHHSVVKKYKNIEKANE